MLMIMSKPSEDKAITLRSSKSKTQNGYNPNDTHVSDMRGTNTQLNLEDDEKFDLELLKRLVKIVEVLQDIED